MALNIYHEARGEPTLGQYLVADTVINRVLDTRWPNTVCAVVFQSYQYSWTLTNTVVNDYAAMDKAMLIAEITLSDNYKPSSCADHYHTTAIKPDWSEGMAFFRAGNHIFYCSGKDTW